VAQRGPSVRWSESAQRWMAWVLFPDGSRRKVERVSKADAQHDLNELLALRASAESPAAPPKARHLRRRHRRVDGRGLPDCGAEQPGSPRAHQVA